MILLLIVVIVGTYASTQLVCFAVGRRAAAIEYLLRLNFRAQRVARELDRRSAVRKALKRAGGE